MSNLYGDTHRKLQDAFDTRRLADVVENTIVKTAVDADDKAFIESRDMFFLATVDHQGRPTVSYKGGAPGFIQCLDASTVIFPSYDGNGMYLSMGNIKHHGSIGLLFIDFENPHRLRLQGEAVLSQDAELMARYTDADLIVKITVGQIFRNCPRYIHKYKKVDPSRFVPRADCEAPLPDWKRLDKLQAVLPARDQGKAAKTGGTITFEELAAIEQRDD